MKSIHMEPKKKKKINETQSKGTRKKKRNKITTRQRENY